MDKREFYDTIYYHFSRVGKALTSPKRMEILDLLTQGPKTVEMLSKETDMTSANTSQHLQVLLDVKLVKFRKRGTFAVYQLASRKVCHLIKSLQNVTEDRFEELGSLRKNFIERPEEIKNIDLETFQKKVENITLIDVRPVCEYNVGHIPGALSIPLQELEQHLNKLAKDLEIVVYSRGYYCGYATEAVKLLGANGFNATRLNAGIQHLMPGTTQTISI